MFEQPVPHKEGEQNLRLRNEMQLALVERYYGFTSREKRAEWFEQHAADFGVLVKSDPSLLQRFANDREAALAEAESKLYARKESV